MPWENPLSNPGESRLILKVIEQAFQEKYGLHIFEAPSSAKNSTNLKKGDFPKQFSSCYFGAPKIHPVMTIQP
jgi:hypothetical protein